MTDILKELKNKSPKTIPGNVREAVFDAKRENIPAVTEFIEAALDAVDCPMKAKMQIDIAVDEVFTNIADYAYPDGVGTAVVRTETDAIGRAITVTFIDRGKPFDPLSAKAPDITASAEDRAIGGLGIFLVRKTMDDVRYEYRDGQNILQIKKHI